MWDLFIGSDGSADWIASKERSWMTRELARCASDVGTRKLGRRATFNDNMIWYTHVLYTF